MAMLEACPHVKEIKNVKPSANGCEECLKMGDTWVHLRMCLICGHVGCCDSSKNKHATKHFHRTQASHHAIGRAGRGLALVLRRRNHAGLKTLQVVVTVAPAFRRAIGRR